MTELKAPRHEDVRLRPERLWMFKVEAGGGEILSRVEHALGLWTLERLTGAWSFGDEETLGQ